MTHENVMLDSYANQWVSKDNLFNALFLEMSSNNPVYFKIDLNVKTKLSNTGGYLFKRYNKTYQAVFAPPAIRVIDAHNIMVRDLNR